MARSKTLLPEYLFGALGLSFRLSLPLSGLLRSPRRLSVSGLVHMAARMGLASR